MNINLDDLTLGQIKEVKAMITGQQSANQWSPWDVGKAYLFRTVTMIVLGKVDHVGATEVALTSASWVADTGRFSEAVASGNLSEVEPFANGVGGFGRGSLVDWTPWHHALPLDAK